MLKLGIKTGAISTTLTLAFLFIFSYGFYGIEPGELFSRLGAEMGAATGAQVLVEENPYNQVAQQLAQKEEELDQREEELGVLLEEREDENQSVVRLILALFFVLFILLASNFYLDFKARKNKEL